LRSAAFGADVNVRHKRKAKNLSGYTTGVWQCRREGGRKRGLTRLNHRKASVSDRAEGGNTRIRGRNRWETDSAKENDE